MQCYEGCNDTVSNGLCNARIRRLGINYRLRRNNEESAKTREIKARKNGRVPIKMRRSVSLGGNFWRYTGTCVRILHTTDASDFFFPMGSVNLQPFGQYKEL